MLTKRTVINFIAFLVISFALVFFGLVQLVFVKGGGNHVAIEFADASGLADRNDVTMRGVPVGTVTSVGLTSKGTAHVTVLLQPGITVTKGTKATIMRRSPIGDMTIELAPGTGPALPDNASIPMSQTQIPPDPEKTIAELARVLHSVPSEDIGTLINELATAVRGRAGDLASLSETGADLPQRILEVQTQLRSLIENGPKVTGVLADNAGALRDDLTQTKLLAQLLRDRRYDLVSLSTNGGNFASVANDLVGGEKANIACLISDLGEVNATLAEPHHLKDLDSTLDLNHFFFDAVYMSVQPGKDGLAWFRVQLVPGGQPQGRDYGMGNHLPPPDVYAADACRSIYGRGVGPGSQPGPVWLASQSHLHQGH